MPRKPALFALFAAGAAGGVLAAQALAEVGLPGVVTVSVPSVSVPVPTTPAPVPTPVPIPPPPTPPSVPPTPVPVPAAETPVSVPGQSSPAPQPAPTPAQPPSGGSPTAPAAPAFGESSPSASGSYSDSGSSSSGRPAGPRKHWAPPVSRLRADPRGFSTRRGARRRAARITFRLSRPARVQFVVRGPAPSCEVVGRFTVRGRRGVNRVRFTGRIGRRTLGPGAYRISAPTPGGHRSVVVVIVRPDGSRPPTSFDCRTGPATPELLFASLADRFDVGGQVRSARAGSSPPPTGRRDAGAQRRRSDESGGVLPALTERMRELRPALGRSNIDEVTPSWIVGILALGAVLLSGLGILAYVFRFVRRPNTT